MSLNQVGETYERPWGTYTTLAQVQGYQVKTITVAPLGRLSLQKHEHRSEHWIVVSGSLLVTKDDTQTELAVGEHIFIPLGSVHRIENTGASPATLVEVQVGDYLGEDDIIRLEDVYGRS